MLKLPRKLRRKTLFNAAAVAAWVALTLSGIIILMRYENRPGSRSTFLASIPSSTKATLFVFAHPKCPCTEATLAELTKILEKNSSRVNARILFFRPRTLDASWVDTSLIRSAREIPGLEVAFDWDGQEADRFGAKTSGQVLVFDPDGKLVFSGGITPSRGHQGENVGASAVETFLETGRSPIREAYVFGCSIKGN